MKSFKQLLDDDLDSFFEEDEFAEEVIIEGKSCNVVYDDFPSIKTNSEGLEAEALLFHVKKIDLDFEPELGMRIQFNNKSYDIVHFKENFGMYTIRLEGFNS